MRGARSRLVALAALTVVAVSGCSSVQESLACPGEHCPAALQRVLDDAEHSPGVTAVDRVWRFFNIDHGHSGGLDVHAAVTTEREARPVAARLARSYRASGVEPVDRIGVRVVPDPELSVPDTAESTLGSGPTAGGDVGCAGDHCADEVAHFVDGFAGAPGLAGATLGRVAWADDDVAPVTSIEVTAPGGAMDADRLDEFRAHILDLAEKSGITAIGRVKTFIHFRRVVEFSFSFEGNRKE